MTNDTVQQSGLLLGKSQLVLDAAVAGLRALGHKADATNDFTNVTDRVDARTIDLIERGLDQQASQHNKRGGRFPGHPCGAQLRPGDARVSRGLPAPAVLWNVARPRRLQGWAAGHAEALDWPRPALNSGGMYDQGAFLIDVAVSGDEEAVELLVAALQDLDDEACCLAVLDAVVEANRREDDEARAAASRLVHAVCDV